MKKHPYKHLVLSIALAVSSGSAMAQASADTVRIVVPFSAGGPTDFMARMLAEPLAEQLGKNVIIDNRPGASGNIGTKHVVDSKPDGMTLVHSTAAMQAVNPLMYPDAGFHPSEDLIPVGITGALPSVLVVHPNSGIGTIDELVEKGRQPGASLNYATFGPGSSPHFFGALLVNGSEISAMPVAYKGSAHAITDMLGGRLDFTFDNMTTSLSHVQAGNLIGLAVTSPERSELLPDVPTLTETGYGDVDMTFWFALQVPSGTDQETVQRLREAVYKATQNPEYREGVIARGVEPLQIEPEALDEFIKVDTEKWSEAARSIGVKAE